MVSLRELLQENLLIMGTIIYNSFTASDDLLIPTTSLCEPTPYVYYKRSQALKPQQVLNLIMVSYHGEINSKLGHLCP